MKITDITSFKNAINKLDNMTQDSSKPNSVFPQKSSQERINQFLEIAQGRGVPYWDD